jgi:hypothetical protein
MQSENLPIRERAIRFAMDVLRAATDWEEGQHALADNDEFGPWLERDYGDSLDEVQAIIREAEKRLGVDLPY